MAACVVEDTVLTSIYCQTTNTMQQSKSSSFETLNQRCPFNCHGNSIQIDSTLIRNHELTKKRQLNRSNTYHSNTEQTRIVIDNSCLAQAVSTNNSNNDESMKRIFISDFMYKMTLN
jgi:hypothetical protein